MYIHKESIIFIQWDPKKGTQNFKKHGITFDEAASVLFDENAIEYYDQEHSNFEDRFWIIGRSFTGQVLLVVYSLRRLIYGKEVYYRIISARVASKKERKAYETKN